MRKVWALVVALFAVAVFSGTASATTITFDDFADGDSLTTQILGLTFTDATVLTAGISLNEFDFPPASGANVVFDSGGPITIAFATPVSTVGAFFTYSVGLTLQAFDASNALVGAVLSAFSTNVVSSGNTPNEFLELASVGGISTLVISGSPGGGSFAMDDLTYQTVPEPSTLALMLTGAAAVVFRRRSVPAAVKQSH